MDDRLLTKKEVIEYLQIHRRTFEKLVDSGELPVIKISPYKRFVRLSHLNQYLDNRTINKPQETTSESQEQPNEEFKWNRIWGKDE
jgi:excisionase family DNA binding protein